MIDPVQAAHLTPSAFARYCLRGKFDLPQHLRLLEVILMEAAAGRKRRVGVSVPPRHGKSWLASWFFPAWYLGLFPHRHVLLASYESSFAAGWGRKVRDVLTEHGPNVFGIRVRQDSHAADRWEIEDHGGGMYALGAGGPLRGRGADLVIIDDPHKNTDETDSETIREKVWSWYQGDVVNRLEPGASVVVLAQRLHQKDLLGHIYSELADKGIEKWERYEFPALAEKDDVLGRKPGEALWPERYNEEALAAIRDGLWTHPQFWPAQYQQHPVALEGGLFKREHARRYVLHGEASLLSHVCLDPGKPLLRIYQLRRFVTVDTATSTKTSANHTAIAAWASPPEGGLVLLDVDVRRIEGPEIMRAIVAMCDRWDCVAYVEENATSKHLLSFMDSEGLTYRTLKPGTTDKWTRAQPFAALWERGKVWLPEKTRTDCRDSLEVAEAQLYGFSPSSGSDDFVDAAGYSARVLLEVRRASSLPAWK